MKMVLVSFVDAHFQCFSTDEIYFLSNSIRLLLDGEIVCTLDLESVQDIKIIR